jgi:hypothetical protein
LQASLFCRMEPHSLVDVSSTFAMWHASAIAV